MITLRKSSARGRTHRSWLDSRHTFSFADYHDPEFMGYSVLRVINQDHVAPGQGFGMHAHHDMEIVTVVLEGALRHRDSLGNSCVMSAGGVQRMSAGTGIEHSEFNASDVEPLHFMQIWMVPAKRGMAPWHVQRSFAAKELRGQWRCIVSTNGRDDSLTLNQDARIYATRLNGKESAEHRPVKGRRLYLHLARGFAALNGVNLRAGDGAFIENESTLKLSEAEDAEALLFDLP